ncbi:hypothetical protein BDZ89DRAFT_1167480 [Hymenopellis radicata]|nr:hypothetical protein BDZ89DRAFT_1167480 [Hymenopellis radicata]
MASQNPPPGYHLSTKGRVVKAGHGGKRSGSGRKPKARVTMSSATPTPNPAPISPPLPPTAQTTTNSVPRANTARFNQRTVTGAQNQQSSSSSSTATFFLPRDLHQPTPLGSGVNLNTGPSNNTLNSRGDANPTRHEPDAAQTLFSAQSANTGVLSRTALSKLNADLAFVEENDEHGDIASGRAQINETIIDELLPEAGNTNEIPHEDNADPPPEAMISQYLRSVQRRIVKEIKKHGKPQCYVDGQFFYRPMHPVFAATCSFGFLILLAGHPEKFKCDCGMHLSKHGYNENPVARRVRAPLGDDYYLLTNRFWCDSNRVELPGCGSSYQGTDSHIVQQLPRFVQEGLPAYLSTRGAVDKQLMWTMNSLIVKRVGPSPFAEMVSELQHRLHARNELMYYSAALHYGLHGDTQIPRFSAFNDSAGYAGCPPSTPYLKAMYTDYIGAHRIYMDRAQAALPLDIAKADHTFDVLKYMGGLKGEKIWKAEYNLVNQFEEVRAECLTMTKSLSFVREMFEKVQDSLKALGHSPTQLLYTDSPQSEQSFHESITRSLANNVQHVSTWTDLPPLQRTPDVLVDFCSYSIAMEELADEVLNEATSAIRAGGIYILGLAIKYHLSKERKPQLDVIQLRTQNRVLIFKVTAFNARSHFVPALIAILSNSSIIKTGSGIRKTLSVIAEALSLPEIQVNTRSSSFIDLGDCAKLAGIIEDPNSSLHTLVGAVLSQCYTPPSPDFFSWSSELPKTTIDVLYTETDVIWQLWMALSQRESVGIRLTPEQAKTHGQLVTIVHGCKPVLRGSIIGHHAGYIDAVMDVDGYTRRVNVTASRSLVRITEVLVPGAIHHLHRQTIQWIFDHGGLIVAATSQLRSRSSTSPLPPTALTFGFSVPAPPSTTLDEDHSDFTISYRPNPSEHTDEIQFDIWEPSLNDMFMEDGSDWDSDSDFDPDETIETVTEAFEHAQSILRRAAEGDSSLSSRVLDDAFHFMDRLLRILSKKHSVFKAFSHDFSEAIFIRDKDDEHAVRSVLEKNGVNWEYAKRAKAGELNRRIRRYIPDRHTLGKRLSALFTGYQDIICSTKQGHRGGRFFCDEAKEMATRLLETVRLGFLSDPQGISLYYVMGKDRDGLTVYRTVRGTNSVEGGVHMAVRRVFGSLKASAELAEKILVYWIFRRNQSVGYRNRTGQKFRGHFDMWVSDEIVEITTLLDVMPSFRLPRLLATRIATVETFGIVPMDTTLASELGITTLPVRRIEGIPHHNDLPVHTLTRLSTHPMNQYRYLQLRQCTLHPVLPVSTHAEYRKFKELINDPIFQRGRGNYPAHEAYKGIDFTLLARSWNDKVNKQDRTISDTNQRLYYKLPAQLEAHHKKTILWKSERSTLFMGDNALALKAFTDIITSEENSTTTLPAIPLPDNENDDAFRTLEDIHSQLDLNSFDGMGLRYPEDRDLNAAADNEYDTDMDTNANSGDVDANRGDINANGGDVNEDMDVDTNPELDNDQMNVDSVPIAPVASTSRQIQQTTLSNSSTLGIQVGRVENVAAVSTKKKGRCAVCCKNMCRRRADCPGKGGRDLCRCGHPPLREGERVRVKEKDIVAFLNAQAKE